MGYSIWLNFTEQSRRKLCSNIKSIAHRYSCPDFHPHLTLVGDMELELDEIRKVARKFTNGAVPSEVPICGIGSSDKYFMALFLAVNIPPELQRLREMAVISANLEDYKLDEPHVSMAYGEFSPSALVAEKEILKSQFFEKTLFVQDIRIVRSSKTVPIAEWKSVETISLNRADSIRVF